MRGLVKSRTQNRRVYLWLTYALLLIAASAAGTLAGVVFGYSVDLPRVEELRQIQPSLVSYVHSAEGQVIGRFALENRILVTYEEIPKLVRQSILAAEDANFFRHSGIDFRRMIVTLINDILYGERKGASTLSMQLSKIRFTSTEVTIERKIKDILYAIDIEKNYSKEQIFTFYCNQIYLGHGNYGIAAAADFYFQKPPAELDASEAALLAGLIQAPSRRSPINHPQAALARRNWVLGRMHALGFLNSEQFQQHIARPLEVRGKSLTESPAPYFVEWVRQYLENQYQTNEIWQNGLRIYTTLDYEMQIAARQALRTHLQNFDKKRRGWVGPESNIVENNQTLEQYSHPDWRGFFYPGQLMHGLVLSSDAGMAEVRIGSYLAQIGLEEVEWTGAKKVSEVLKRGDVAIFQILEINRAEKTIRALLDQIPEVQGAFLCIDNKTGAIRAMIGGFDFEFSKFNRATQALRQPGSIFKPFTYVAALEAGYQPSDEVLDAPVTFEDALGRPYEPANSDKEFKGLITIEEALAGSRNVPTVRLANALGPQRLVEVARRFGISGNLPPYLSLALGSAEVTLYDMTSAFTTFPNHGVRAQPYFVKRVEDRTGSMLEERQPRVEAEVLSPEVADKMMYLLRNVVLKGTAWKARELGRPVAGKTGTTNDSTDVWFIGFTPQITAGVWIGYDEKKSLGERVYGATLALPVWIDFMKAILEKLPPEDFPSSYQPSGASGLLMAEQRAERESTNDRPDRKKGIKVEDINPDPPE